jgi:hypothetical protein
MNFQSPTSNFQTPTSKEMGLWKLEIGSWQLAFFCHKLDLEQLRPQLTRHEQPPAGCIVGNPVEHVGASALRLG